jgi:cytochrome c oxidase cbb3-type subunit III
MSVGERDPHTGYLTTGHDWDGITELNTPVPRTVYFFLILSFVFSVGYWVLMPAWPIGATYTKGLLGLDQRDSVRTDLKEAALERTIWSKQIENQSFADIQANAPLMTIVRRTGRVLFGENCAACHGIDAKGGPGFPNLTSGSWLWGGDPQAIAETIRVGINSTHPSTRTSQMLAFGRDQLLPAADISKVAAYVRTLSNPMAAQDTKSGDVEAGKAIFAANCVSCHGDDGKGKTDVGGPDLTSGHWIYGGDLQSIATTIWGGRQGRMPSWEERLSPLDRKILTLYVVDQGRNAR